MNSEIPIKKKGTNKGWANLIPIKPGEVRNPHGRPKGQRDYATIYREAIIKLAKMKNVTPEQFETDMIAMGIAKGSTDYRFFKDAMDRTHGLPTQRIEQSGTLKVESAFSEEQMERIAKELLNKKK